MSDNDTPGTWDEIITHNEQDLRELELRIVRSEHRELRLWKDMSSFMVGKGTAASTERWYLLTPLGDHYGDSLQEVLEQAMLHGYADIFEWSHEWNER